LAEAQSFAKTQQTMELNDRRMMAVKLFGAAFEIKSRKKHH
jgi:hypothetical protein